ncbi:hypothetical protein SAMN05661080_00165 [Modestobacter sp. DSM 44400]|uniref:DUF6541 family protein n=1 Tax=Modestobacter sp. DSM 44400 TaxID=1550230 RepID=UPI0008978DB9|nr:DUF6541 family protein [Modestobacter sp. DSM 44400]SDX49358.1 hypothetical protein SAMN05661080_00165 [Modestobacter sp. DSM 44400]
MSLHAFVIPVVSLLALSLPGMALGLLAGLRPSTALACSPVFSYGVITTSATVASFLPFSWNPVALVVATGLAGLLVVAARLATGRARPWRERLAIERPQRPSLRGLLVAGGVAGGGLLSAGVLLAGFGRLGAPNQDWDYVFHASAVRLIADSGDLAPTAMRQINDWESTSFYYPNTFHGLAAVVEDLTGGTVFEVLNSQAMLVCLVAGLGLAGLLHRLGAPLAVTATAPVLLAGFASFPYDVLWRGPLLPYAAGVAAIPAFLLVLDIALSRRSPALTLLFGLSAAGLLGLHPSTALSAGIFVIVYLLVRWVRSPRTVAPDLLVLVAAGVLAVAAAVPAIRGAITTGEAANIDWPAVESPGQAAGDLLLLNHEAPAPQYWLAALLVVGLLTVVRARYMWGWLGGAAVTFGLFVMAAASDSQLVAAVTGPWWNDRWRFAALTVLGFAPLAAHGLWTLAQTAQRGFRRVLGARGRRVTVRTATGALVAAGLLLVVAGSNGLYAGSNATRVEPNYRQERTLNATEVAAMLWLARHSSGGTIMNDSKDGSAYLSAVAGLHPLFGHIVEPRVIPTMGPTQQLLLEHFNCLDSDADVRAAVEELDIRYVFLGSGYVRPDFGRVPGLVGVDESPSLELVHTAPGVQVYAVDLSPNETAPIPACTLPGPNLTDPTG